MKFLHTGVFLSLAGASLSHAMDVQGLAAAVQGVVQLESKATDASLRQGDRVAAGSDVRTGADARVTLALIPGTSVALSAESHLRILDLQLDKEGHQLRSRRASIELVRGELFGATGGTRLTPGDFEILTPAGTIRAGGSAFAVRVVGSECEVVALDHAIEIVRGSERVRVEPGEKVSWSTDGAFARSQADGEAVREVLASAKSPSPFLASFAAPVPAPATAAEEVAVKARLDATRDVVDRATFSASPTVPLRWPF